MDGRYQRILLDLRFSNGCLRRWVIRYIFAHYKCGDCGFPFYSDNHHLGRSPYSASVLAYVIYNIIEVHIPQIKLSHIMRKMFGFPLGEPTINRMIQRGSDKYRDTYEAIKERLLLGKLVHADETHISVKGKKSYVWVFTSMEEVIYIWSATREGYGLRFSGLPTATMSNSFNARLE